MNYSTLEPLSYTTPLYDTSFDQEWKGQRSSKFPPTIRRLPTKDLIRKSIQIVIETFSYQTKRPNVAKPTFMSRQA